MRAQSATARVGASAVVGIDRDDEVLEQGNGRPMVPANGTTVVVDGGGFACVATSAGTGWAAD